MYVHRKEQDMRINGGSGYRIFGDDIFDVATDHLIILKNGRAIEKTTVDLFLSVCADRGECCHFFLDVSQLAACSVLCGCCTLFLRCLYAPEHIDIGYVLTFFNLSWSELHVRMQHIVYRFPILTLFTMMHYNYSDLSREHVPQVHCVKLVRAPNNFE